MRESISWVTRFLVPGSLLLGSLLVSLPLSADTLRKSHLGRDVVISQSLYKALKNGAGKIAHVSVDGGTYSISVGNDRLSCDDTGCSLSWDTTSSNYGSAIADFNTTLFDTLDYWLGDSSGGQTERDIKITEALGGSDYVHCVLIPVAGVSPVKSCSIVVSDYAVGTSAELQKTYQDVLAGQTYLAPEITALLSVVQSSSFLGPSDSQYGNRQIQATHTIYTDLLIDRWVVASNYAYTAPITNSAGQVLANGITLTFEASEDQTGHFVIQSVESTTYALSN